MSLIYREDFPDPPPDDLYDDAIEKAWEEERRDREPFNDWPNGQGTYD